MAPLVSFSVLVEQICIVNLAGNQLTLPEAVLLVEQAR